VSQDSAGAEHGPSVATATRLLHRRRGWATAATGGFIGFIVLAGVLGSIPDKGAGTAVLSVFVLLLAALVVVSVIAVIVDTVKLRGHTPEVRRHALRQTPHYPVRTHAYRYPPRHKVSWVFTWIILLFLLGFGVATLPGLVDGVAYVAGAESTATFMPTSYGQVCGRGGCSTVTNGVLETGGGGASAQWPRQVPLGQPFKVHQPLWNFGFGNMLIDGPGTAAGLITAGVLMDTFSVFIVLFAVKAVRRWLNHRRESRQLVTSG
jgi:hypothetical protein